MDKKKKVPDNIAGGKVIKKPLGERIAETLFSGTIKDAKGFVLEDVVKPTLRRLLYDSCTGALDKLINGKDAGSYTGYGKNWQSGYTIFGGGTNYASMSSKTKASQVLTTNSRTPANIVYAHEDGAKYVLDRLRDELNRYPEGVTVSAYYDIAREVLDDGAELNKAMNYTDEYFGWVDLSGARIHRVTGGATIILPPTIQLKK